MKILVVEPDPDVRDALRRAFAAGGAQVRGFVSAAEATPHLVDFRPDAVAGSPGAIDRALFVGHFDNGLPESLLPSVWAVVPEEKLDDGVAAMDRGADDFLWTPVSAARVASLLAKLASRREREIRAEEDRLRLARLERAVALPGRSARWTAAMGALERLAPERAVLVTGEEGTEKEAAARFLHRLSPRGAGPFVRINDGESPADALGRARHGSLFAPGIDGVGAAVQQVLLAAIDERREPAVIVASDRDPSDAARRGDLSAELVERLRDSVLHLPPLRERGEDVARLARHFLEEASDTLSFDVEAIDALTAHDWPGNVQELREAVRRAARLAEGPTIGPLIVRSVLGRPLAARGSRRRRVPVVRITVGDSLADVERRLIQKTLEFARGNKRKTAELLKLSLKTIYNKIKEYGLEH